MLNYQKFGDANVIDSPMQNEICIKLNLHGLKQVTEVDKKSQSFYIKICEVWMEYFACHIIHWIRLKYLRNPYLIAQNPMKIKWHRLKCLIGHLIQVIR